jgi:hypothetical protein
LNSAALVQLAAARGIDLQHVAGVASNFNGIARPRPQTDFEREHGIAVSQTVRGRETRVRKPATWSHAELGQAAKDLGIVPWNAALYSFAGNQEGYWLLWHALASEANKISRRERWAPQVAREGGGQMFYREPLAQLVLDEDRSRHLFTAAPVLYPAYMCVAPTTWDRHLAGPFMSLKNRYESWLAAARCVIGKWIRSEE